MKFSLIDRITDLKKGESLSAVKNVSLAEEYLADHFPLAPLLPGVMMLEGMTQAAVWLVRVTEDFSHSMVHLREARNVKYSGMVSPGDQLALTVKWLKEDAQSVRVQVKGMVGEKLCVSARLVIGRYNFSDTDPDKADLDERIRQDIKGQYHIVRPEVAPKSSESD